jgi:hypothetical protein
VCSATDTTAPEIDVLVELIHTALTDKTNVFKTGI